MLRTVILVALKVAATLKILESDEFDIYCPAEELPCDFHNCEELKFEIRSSGKRIFERIVIRNGETITFNKTRTSTEKNFTWNDEDGVFTVKRASLTDQGIYSCIITARKNATDPDREFSMQIFIEVLRLPIFHEIQSHRKSLRATQQNWTDTASCIYSPGKPEAKVVWINVRDQNRVSPEFFRTKVFRSPGRYRSTLYVFPAKITE